MQQATKTLLSAICLTAASAVITQVSATCWDEASNDYGVPVDVLKAVAKTEEPANMGAWSHIAVNQPEYGWKCVSRRAASSPATGFPKAHEKEQGEIVEKAFGK